MRLDEVLSLYGSTSVRIAGMVLGKRDWRYAAKIMTLGGRIRSSNNDCSSDIRLNVLCPRH